jgi:hypothetical protein
MWTTHVGVLFHLGERPVDIQQFRDIAIGTPVIVYSFGTYYGRVTGKQPIVTIMRIFS